MPHDDNTDDRTALSAAPALTRFTPAPRDLTPDPAASLVRSIALRAPGPRERHPTREIAG